MLALSLFGKKEKAIKKYQDHGFFENKFLPGTFTEICLVGGKGVISLSCFLPVMSN